MSSTPSVLVEVRAAYKAGLTLLPVAEDGTKRPALPEWKTYQQQRPTPEVMRHWNFANRAGFGMVAGPVSGYCESWDFDDAETFEAFLSAAAAAGLSDLIQRIRAGYEDQTPDVGRRWIVKYSPDVTWADTAYARRPGRPGEKPIVTLIETTLFAVLAPSNGSVHPSGRPYVRVSGSFATIAAYTSEERDAVIALARSFDQMPRRAAARPPTTAGTRPGDDFNARASWSDILTPHGWTAVGARGSLDYWRRPEKSFGISASTNRETGLLWMFTSSTEFAPDVSYTKFGAFTLLEHGGDHAAAAKALVRRGYGASGAPVSASVLAAVAAPEGRHLRTIPATNFQIAPVRWLWQDRVPLGALTLVGGREGIGKSLCTTALAAQVTRGTLPGALEGIPRAVFIVATEDSWKHTIVPRLMAAEADLTRVFCVEVVAPAGVSLAVSLPQDLVALEDEARRHDVALIVFDPLLSRLDSALDTHKDGNVRQALEPLAAMADRLDAALVGLIHVSKAQSSDALTLLMGSRAFAAVARAVLFTMIDPDDDARRLLGQPKNNLGRTDLATLTFTIHGVCVATSAQGEIWTGQLQWGESVDRTIHEALESLADQRSDRQQVMEAGTWLCDYLTEAGGTAAADAIVKAARTMGFSRATMYRAQAKLQLKHAYRGFPRTAFWILSSQSSQLSQSHGDEDDETAGTGMQSSQLSHATETTETTETAQTGGRQSSQPSRHAETETTETTETTATMPAWVTEDENRSLAADDAAFAAHDDELRRREDATVASLRRDLEASGLIAPGTPIQQLDGGRRDD
jgi:hypothetical protein